METPKRRRRVRRAATAVAVDLGTAYTRVYARGRGLIADEPSLVRTRAPKGGRGIVRPALRGGVIADTEAATLLLQRLLWRERRPAVLVCAPSDARPEEVDVLREVAARAGASRIAVVPEPIAAAIGSGLDVGSPYAQMVVDIGDGVTDIALIRSGEIAGTWAVRTGCGELRAAVGTAISHAHGLHLWRGEAERLVGEAMTGADRLLATGQDSVTGRGRKGWVPASVVVEAAEPFLATIVAALRRAWGDLSPDVSCEVIESGVLLVGGGSLVRGLRELLARETQLDVRSPADPLHAVITGARVMLDAGLIR